MLSPMVFADGVLKKANSAADALARAKSMIIVYAKYNSYIYQVIIPKASLTSSSQYFCACYATSNTSAQTTYVDSFYVAANTGAISPGLTHNGASVTASATFEYYVD